MLQSNQQELISQRRNFSTIQNFLKAPFSSLEWAEITIDNQLSKNIAFQLTYGLSQCINLQILKINILRKDDEELSFEIQSLISSFNHLKNLLSLTFNCNKCQKIVLEDLSEFFFALQNCKNMQTLEICLELKGDKRELDFRGLINLTNLQDLKLSLGQSHIHLQKLGVVLEKLSNLLALSITVVLYEENNKQLKSFYSALKKLTNLKHLSLLFSCDGILFNFSDIYEFLPNLTNLQTMVLQLKKQNYLSFGLLMQEQSKIQENLGLCLQQCINLSELTIDSRVTFLNNQYIQEILTALPSFPNLETFKLFYSYKNSPGEKYEVNFLNLSKCLKLSNLELYFDGYQRDEYKTLNSRIAQDILYGLRFCSSLINLDLYMGWFILQQLGKELGEVLLRLSNLQNLFLRLNECPLNMENLLCLFDCFSKCKNIKNSSFQLDMNKLQMPIQKCNLNFSNITNLQDLSLDLIQYKFKGQGCSENFNQLLEKFINLKCLSLKLTKQNYVLLISQSAKKFTHLHHLNIQFFSRNRSDINFLSFQNEDEVIWSEIEKCAHLRTLKINYHQCFSYMTNKISKIKKLKYLVKFNY